MVLPFLIGGGVAIAAGFLFWRGFKTVDDVRNDIRNAGRATTDIATDVRHDVFGTIERFTFIMRHIVCSLTNNINAITYECLNSIARISHRIDVSVHLLTNTIMAFFTTCSLSLLLYLTSFSPFLRTIVWFLFFSLCFFMVRNYVTHSNLLLSSQQYIPSIHSMPNNNNNNIIREATATMAPVKPLIKQELIPNNLSYKPCAVIMGRSGAGKTTLFNGLCGTQRAANDARKNITQNLFRSDVNCGNHPFSLIDTPGIDSSTDISKYAFILKDGLTNTAINTIFIVIKYESRFDKLIDNYFEVEQPVYNYTRKVIVIISYWDQSKDPENSFKEIRNLFEEECPNVTNLIFCSEQSSKTEVANLMYSCISNMNQETLQIEDNEFFLKLNIHEMKSQMKTSFGEYQKKAAALVQEYTDLIKSVSVEDKDEVLHMTIVKFKDEMEDLLQNFQHQYGGPMAELDYYALSIKMQKENVKICDDFVEKVVPLMSYNLFDNQDPRNLIKRCPHCQLIWFKTEGCDGITTCGNNSFANPSDTGKRPYWKYQLQRIGGKLHWAKNPIENNSLLFKLHQHTNSSFRRMHRIMGDRSRREAFGLDKKSQQIGCGKELIWSKLPKIEDELILELFKVKTIDKAKQMIQAGCFQEARQTYESSIDSNIYF